MRSLPLLLAATLACAGTPHPTPVPVPEPPPGLTEATIFLIGDAGNPAPGGEPVIEALARQVARAPGSAAVVFLGDNIYPRGLPDSASPARAEAERRMNGQVDPMRPLGVPVFFVPGNHDWAGQGSGGWDAIRREARYITQRGGAAMRLLPADGCPGPVVVDFGARARFVFLDTQWWLHGGPKPRGAGSGCPAGTEDGVVDSLRSTLAAAGGREVLVLGHHPLASGGPHGGHFTWKDHLFPLRAVNSWLWLPLPVIGSAYPLARKWGVTAQDQSSGSNKRMRAALEGAFADHPPLVYASGHEHTLQVVGGRTARYVLVSGAGIADHESPTAWSKGTLFALAHPGFQRLDFLRDGRVRLGVIDVDASGRGVERFSMWLRN